MCIVENAYTTCLNHINIREVYSPAPQGRLQKPIYRAAFFQWSHYRIFSKLRVCNDIIIASSLSGRCQNDDKSRLKTSQTTVNIVLRYGRCYETSVRRQERGERTMIVTIYISTRPYVTIHSVLHYTYRFGNVRTPYLLNVATY